jgi:DNA repair protein RadD
LGQFSKKLFIGVSVILKYFGIKELQELIGTELLERLEVLLPVLGLGDADPSIIYKKSNLIKIFASFLTTDHLRSKKFLNSLFNYLPEELINEFIEIIYDSNTKSSFSEKVNKLVKASNQKLFVQELVKWADFSEGLIPESSVAFPDSEQSLLPRVPYKTLKDFQFSVFLEAHQTAKIPRSRFIIQMPTGSGKTRTSMEIITQFFITANNPSICIWLANSEELCDQAVECFSEVWEHVGNSPLTIYRCWGTNSGLPENLEGNAFVVAGFSKLYSLFKNNQLNLEQIKSQIGLIIVDEAHQAIAPTYKETINCLLGENSVLIGLTATPGRSAIDASQNEELSKYFFNKIINIHCPEDVSVIEMLRSKNILADIDFEELKTHKSYSLTEEEIKYLEEQRSFPPGFLQKIGSDDIRNIEIVKKLNKELESNKQTLFFSCSVDHSKFICSILIYLGFRAVHIDGSTNKKMRSKYIKDFRNGNIQIICNFGILSTGFDAPKTDLVFIARPTASLVLYSQMLGRGLRGPAIGGTEWCKVITVRDNIKGYSNLDHVYSYFEDYFS